MILQPRDGALRQVVDGALNKARLFLVPVASRKPVEALRDQVEHVLAARRQAFVGVRRPADQPEVLVVQPPGQHLVIIEAVHVLRRGGDDAVVRLQLRRGVQSQVDHRHRDGILVAHHAVHHRARQVLRPDQVQVERFGVDVRHHHPRADLRAVRQPHAHGAPPLQQDLVHACIHAHAHAQPLSHALQRFRDADHAAARVVDAHVLRVGHHGVRPRHQVGRQPKIERLVAHGLQHLLVLEVLLQNCLVGGQESRQELEEARVLAHDGSHVAQAAGRHLEERVQRHVHQVVGEGGELPPARPVRRAHRADDAPGLFHRKRVGHALAIREDVRHDRVAGDQVHLVPQGGAQPGEHALHGLDDLHDGGAHVKAEPVALKGGAAAPDARALLQHQHAPALLGQQRPRR